MNPRDVQMLVQRLYGAGPLLYIGIALMVDPAGLIRSTRRLAEVIQDFAPWNPNERWRRHLHLVSPAPASPRAERWMRVCGAAISAAAILMIAAA